MKIGYSLLYAILLVFCFQLLNCCADINTVGPEEGETCSFVVFGDVQQGYGIYSQLAKNIGNLKPEPKAAFCCGDIMLRPANEAEWVSFWNFSKPVTDKMPLFILRGNHEGNDQASESILQQMGQISGVNFYRSLRINESFLILLDTYIKNQEQAITGEQLNWLKTQLESAQFDTSVIHIFIFMHHPLFPQGFHMGSDLINADDIHQLFLQYNKIRIVFSGHDHMYNKYVKNEMIYITTGGGGGILYHGHGGDYHHFVKVSFYIDNSRINIKTIGIFNEIIENFDL